MTTRKFRSSERAEDIAAFVKWQREATGPLSACSDDPGSLVDEPEQIDPEQCDECGSTSINFTFAGIGKYCGRACYDKTLNHQQFMDRR